MFKNINIVLIALILFFIKFNPAMAQTTSENDVNKLYKKFVVLMFPQTDNALERFQEMPEAMDIAIEILKKAPGSIEAYGALHIFRRGMEYNEDTIKKYKQLKEKYMPLLDDMENDMAEKLIMLRLMFFQDPGSSEKECNKNYCTCLKTLIKIKDECKNKDYAALALSCLFSVNIIDQDPLNEFIQKYPDHPEVPGVKLEQTIDLINAHKADEAIEVINKLCDKYGHLPRPDGFNFEVECYWTLISAYFEKNDKATARKYFELIKKKAPNHPALFDLSQEFKN